jgi:hypothetical protein
MGFKSLSTGKQYKNVYTILEKVKKGEIKSYYNENEGGLFGKINFYKKPDLVKPYLHYLDAAKLRSIMSSQVYATSLTDILQDCYKSLTKSRDYKKWVGKNNGGELDAREFHKELKNVYADFPEHLQNDIFNMYYNKIEDVDFETRTDKNHSKYKFLERSNNPVGKIMSERSNLKSGIFMRNVLLYYLTRLVFLKISDKESYKKMKNSLNGGNDFDNSDIDNMFDKDFGAGSSSEMMNDMIEKASELCKKMDEVMDEETQEQMFQNIERNESTGASKLDAAYIENVRRKLLSIKMNMSSVKDKIKKLMDRSISYFSAKKETIQESLFDTDNVAGLDEFVLLHPKLRKIFAEDITVKDTKSIGKVDVYVDISGSMSDTCNINDTQVSKLDFAKSFIAELKNQDLLNEIYLFNTKVKKIKNDLISLAMIDTSGGTDIDVAVKKVIDNKNNAIIITDAEDHCTNYSDKAYFIGVSGARFHHFNPECIKRYSDAGQVIVFDGKKVYSVNAQGNIVK